MANFGMYKIKASDGWVRLSDSTPTPPGPTPGGNSPIIDEHTIGVWHFDTIPLKGITGNPSKYTVYNFQDTATDTPTKFGTGAVYCHSSQNVTNVTEATSFTVDWWAYITKGQRDSNYIDFGIGGVNGIEGLRFHYYAGLEIFVDGLVSGFVGVATYNDWTHCAITYDKDTREARFWINGKSITNAFVDINPLALQYVYMKRGDWWGFGFIDELRISDVVRYTSDFTPLDEPYREA